MPRALWLTADVPTSARTGAESYSRGLSGALADAGVEVVGLGLAAPGAEPADGAVRWRGVTADRRPVARNLVSRWPNLSSACAVPGLRAAIDETLASGRWDAVVVDHLQMAWAWPGLRRWRDRSSPSTRLVFVDHNYEAGVRREIARGAQGSALRRAILRYDAAKAARLERMLLREADLVTAITEEDAREIRRDRPDGDIAVLTPGYDGEVADRRISSTVPRRAVVFGSFDWHVKLENLRRIVAAADPVFAAAGVELVIAGRVPDVFEREVAATCRATRCLGFVPSIPAALQECRIGIVSEPAGGGFKMKVLDYVFNGLVVAQLSGSVAGVPLEAGPHSIVARDEAALARAVVEAIDDVDRLDRMQRGALERCEGAFSWRDRGVTLAGLLTRPVTSRGPASSGSGS